MKDKYPLAHINDLLDQLQDAIVLLKDWSQVGLSPIKKSRLRYRQNCFSYEARHYEFVVMSFGVEIRGQGVIPLTRTDEKFFTPREMEQKAAELAYFLRVPIEVFWVPIFFWTKFNEE